jgi:ribosome-associated protein
MQEEQIDPQTVVELAAEAAAAVKPTYLAILDLTGLCAFADRFLIVSADSGRQVRAIAERVEARLDEIRVPMRHREGVGEAHWILLDYHDVVVHIFDDRARQFYDLERLWGDAPRRVVVG